MTAIDQAVAAVVSADSWDKRGPAISSPVVVYTDPGPTGPIHAAAVLRALRLWEPVRSLIVIDRTTGLTSVYRDDEAAAQ